MHQIISAEFNGTAVDIIDRDGKKWLTAEQIGRCLGYNEANASQGVRNLHNRHADEFTDADTCQIKLIWQGQGRELRMFSDTGCIKLGFFANTVRAKEFRTWASQVLAGQPPAPAHDMALAREVGQLKDALAATQKLVAGLTRQLLLAKDREIRALRQRMEEDTQRRIDRVILLEAAGTPRTQIAASTGLSFNYIRQIVFRARRDGHLGIDVTPQQGSLAFGGGSLDRHPVPG